MADKTIKDLPSANKFTSSDSLHISQGGVDKKLPADTLLGQISGGTPFNLSPTTFSGTTKTVTISDRNSYIKFTSNFTITLTVTPSALSPWEVGDSFYVRKEGAGDIVLVGGAGVTINPSVSGTIITELRQTAQLIYLGSNSWDLVSGGIGGGLEGSAQISQNTADIAQLDADLTTTGLAIAAEEAARINAISTEASARATAISQEASDRAAAILQEVSNREAAVTNAINLANTADSALDARIDIVEADIVDVNTSISAQNTSISAVESRLNDTGGNATGITIEQLSASVTQIEADIAGGGGAASIESVNLIEARLDDTGTGLSIEGLATKVDTVESTANGAATTAGNSLSVANAANTAVTSAVSRLNNTGSGESIEAVAAQVSTNTATISTVQGSANAANIAANSATSRLNNTGGGLSIETLASNLLGVTSTANTAFSAANAASTLAQDVESRLDDTGGGLSIETLASNLLTVSSTASGASASANAAQITANTAITRLNNTGSGQSIEALSTSVNTTSATVGTLSATVTTQATAITSLQGSVSTQQAGFAIVTNAGDSTAAIEVTADGGVGSEINLKADRVLIDDGVTRTNLFDGNAQINFNLLGNYYSLFSPATQFNTVAGDTLDITETTTTLPTGTYQCTFFIDTIAVSVTSSNAVFFSWGLKSSTAVGNVLKLTGDTQYSTGPSSGPRINGMISDGAWSLYDSTGTLLGNMDIGTTNGGPITSTSCRGWVKQTIILQIQQSSSLTFYGSFRNSSNTKVSGYINYIRIG